MKIRIMRKVNCSIQILTLRVFFVLMLPMLAQASVETEALDSIQKTSKAFTAIAKKVMPTVVFISVEKTIEAGQAVSPFEYNNPFDLFNDDFFNRFFGYRYPHMQPRKYKQVGMGSGFIISEDGYILTNHHVVGDSDKITVRLKDGREFKAKIIGSDPRSDVALIKIKDSSNLPVLSLGDSDSLEVGEWVMAIKDQLIEHGEVRRGYLGVSIQDLTKELMDSFDLKDTEGVLISDVTEDSPADKAGIKRGDVIMEYMNKEIRNSGRFRNLVALTPPGTKVKIALIRDRKRIELVAELGSLEQAKVAEVSQTDVMEKLGFSVQDLTEDLARQFGYSVKEGVIISQVAPGTPTQFAGLKPGVLILEVNREGIKSVQEFLQAIKGSKSILLLVQEGQYTRYVILQMG